MSVRTTSEAETFELGLRLGRSARAGEIYCLEGELGVGKTVFAKGFARGLGIEEVIDSPTFTIVKEYEGRLPLYHFDTYRIGDESEMDELGYEEYFYGEGVCLIEWPSRIAGLIPPEAVRISIKKDLSQGTDMRLIEIEGKALTF